MTHLFVQGRGYPQDGHWTAWQYFFVELKRRGSARSTAPDAVGEKLSNGRGRFEWRIARLAPVTIRIISLSLAAPKIEVFTDPSGEYGTLIMASWSEIQNHT